MNFKILKDYRFKLLLIVIVIVISFLIWGIYKLANKLREDNFFPVINDVNEIKEEDAKLMIVDQDTGQISFISKTLYDINNLFTDETTNIENALKRLLGENLDQSEIQQKYRAEGNDGILKKLGIAIKNMSINQNTECDDGDDGDDDAAEDMPPLHGSCVGPGCE